MTTTGPGLKLDRLFMKPLAIVLMLLSTALLLAYPFVLIANLMSLAAIEQGGDMSALQKAAFYTFVAGSTLYPIPCLVALVQSIREIRKTKPAKALAYQLANLVYLGVVAVALLGWSTY